MDCDHCGAPVRDEGAFCSHCGARIKRAVDATPAHRTATAPERFDLVERHSGYAKACAHQPKISVGAEVGASIAAIVFGVVFMVLSLSLMSGDSMGPPGWFMVLFMIPPLAIVGFGVATLARTREYLDAPIRQVVAVVVDERVSVSGGGKNSSASTSYHASLQTRDGARVEYECESLLAGRIAVPDIGVAFLKGKRLVDFIRIEA